MKLEILVSDIYKAISNKFGKEYLIEVVEVGQGANTQQNKKIYFQNSTNTAVNVEYSKNTKILSTSKEVQLIIQSNEEIERESEEILNILLRYSNSVSYDVNNANAFKTATKNDLKKQNINYNIFTFVVTKMEIKNVSCTNC
ncbi:MAG: hypothetical protein IT276_14885 [Ignavibacteriaceae bacterium]|nr:hypothetical protein [Ignavibacteriaceae bacterium]